MDFATIFLLSLLGGYCLAYMWRATAFTTMKVEGQHLHFRAALCGVILFLLALAVHAMLMQQSPAYRVFVLGLGRTNPIHSTCPLMCSGPRHRTSSLQVFGARVDHSVIAEPLVFQAIKRSVTTYANRPSKGPV